MDDDVYANYYYFIYKNIIILFVIGKMILQDDSGEKKVKK